MNDAERDSYLLRGYRLAHGRNWFSIAQYTSDLDPVWIDLLTDGHLTKADDIFGARHISYWKWNLLITPKGFEVLNKLVVSEW